MAKTTKSGKANKSLVSGGMIVVVIAVILAGAVGLLYLKTWEKGQYLPNYLFFCSANLLYSQKTWRVKQE